ncbi:MAG TPA: hypothetical protein VMI10_19760 [Terriglobales bacterium]|nr:hypothetical protein [Terriglobales bacterium]
MRSKRKRNRGSPDALTIRVLDYQALVRDRQRSRDEDERLLASGQISPLELQARNSLFYPRGEIEIVSLPAYCLDDDAIDAGEF